MSDTIVNKAEHFDDLKDGFNSKAEELKICSQIRGGWGKDTVDEINECYYELQKISNEVQMYKNILKEARSQIRNFKNLYSMFETINSRLSNIQMHLPDHLPSMQNVNRNIITSNCNQLNEKDAQKQIKEKFCQHLPKSENAERDAKTATNLPKIDYITLQEFESVPKYTKGRITYEKVNQAIDDINKAIQCKYNLIKKPRSKLTPIEMSLVSDYKKQLKPETKGLRFVVDEDIKRFCGMKLDTCGRNILIILRTLKRLKEIRGPGALVRYCIV